MPLPGNVNTVSIHGKYVLPTGIAASGIVTFSQSNYLRDPSADTVIVPTDIVAQLNGTGEFTVTLVATDDPDLDPTGFTYKVVEQISGTTRTYNIVVPLSSTTIEISDLAPSPPSSGIVWTYVPVSEKGVANGVATLDATGKVPSSQLPTISGGHVIQDEGTARTARTGLNFVGAGVTVTDDSANNRTNVSIPGTTTAFYDEFDARAPKFSVLDPVYQGPSGAAGIGNVAADTYAIQAALADIYSGSSGTNGKEKALYFPGGIDYHINTTIQWPEGVHLRGNAGAGNVAGRPIQFRWDGAAGGKMFDAVTAGGGRVNNTVISDAVFREGTARPGKWWEIGDETLVGFSGIDFGTEFYNCHFYNADAPAGAGALDFRFGPTNLFITKCRWDNWTGAAVRIAVNNAASNVYIEKITMDNVSSGGFNFWLDGTGGGNNKTITFALKHGKLEINSTLVGEKTVILCTMDATASQGIQHRVHVEDMQFVPAPTTSTDYSLIKALRTDAALTRHIYAYFEACQYGPGATGASRLIDGVVDPPNWGVYTGKIPDWKYTPQGYGFATPGGEGYFSDFQTQERIRDLWIGNGDMSTLNSGRGIMHIHNALAVPTANPTGGVYLYAENGVLKYRKADGTIVTL